MAKPHLVVSICGLLCIPVQIHATKLTLARAPQQSPSVITRNWTPLINWLNKETGYQISLKVYRSREQFELDLVSGKADLQFGNPAYFNVSRHLHGHIPLIRSNKKRLKGILVVRRDSKIKSVNELNGKQIVFPTRTAFAASLYIREHLTNKQKLKFTPHYLKGGHDNVYRNVASGNYLAGAGVYRTLNSEPAALRARLKVLDSTPGLMPHPLSAHPRVNKKTREIIIKAILKLSKTEKGRKMLARVKIKQPVRASYKNDYAPIMQLSLRMYNYLTKQK